LISHILKHSEYLSSIIPAEFIQKLKQEKIEQLKKALNYTNYIIQSHELFVENNIPHCFFKGPLLSFELYGDVGYRNFGDIDILVNNAGITQDTLLMRMTEQQWDTVISVNLKSVFNFTKAVQKYMLKQKYGSIINMSSVVGVSGNAGQSNYSASKAGIIGFTKSIAKELGSRNIRCNAIAPGFIITEMTAKLPEDVRKSWEQQIPLRRGGTPEDVANVTLFLASDLSAYVSGQVINVCGAMNT